MSALESSVREFDRTKAAGVKLLRDNEIDFDEWSMLDAETAKVRPASDWSQDVIDHFSMPGDAQGAMLPWSITHNRIRLRLGELSVWAGVNGHGKSMLLSHVTLDLMVRQSETVCIASLEMRPLATLARMARQATAQDTPGPREVRAFYAALNERLWLYDQQGTIRHDRMLAVVRYAREHLGVNHFVIDSLMKCGINGDDYNVQKRFVDNLATYARDSGLHIHLIAHSRKRESEHKPMDKFDIKGASEITDLADNVFTLWRNKRKRPV